MEQKGRWRNVTSTHQESMQKSLQRYTWLIALAVMGLLLCAFFVFQAARSAEYDSHTAYVDAILGEYQVRFDNRLDSDRQVLSTLAEALSKGNFTSPDGQIVLPECSQFNQLDYFPLDGDGEPQSLDLEPEVQAALEQAWQGEPAISQVFHGNGVDQIAYAVPVMDGPRILGALVGQAGLDRFLEILNGKTYYGQRLDLTWVDGDGQIIAQSYPSNSQSMEQLIPRVWQNLDQFVVSEQDIARMELSWDGVRYPVYRASLEYNQWYLLYDDSNSQVESPAFDSISTLSIILMCLLLLSFGSLIYTTLHVRRDKQAIVSLSDYDPLTQIYNAGEFRIQAQDILDQDCNYGVVILNYRHFHYVNSIFGREVANRILIETARRLSGQVLADELVCRFKNDEFCLLLRTQGELELRRRIGVILDELASISHQFHVNYSFKLYCGASMAAKQLAPRVEDLMDQAEYALKTIKGGYGNDLAFYDSAVHEEKVLQSQIESRMEGALSGGEFRLYLQPKKNLSTGRLCGAEALVRWVQHDGTMIYPNQFIPLFETNGFCAKLDLYMVEEVCKWLSAWRAKGMSLFPISVNQSKILVYQTNYIESLCQITQRYQIPNRYIVLEILEGLVADNVEALAHTMEALRSKGFQISMDDFGSGYSSLNVFTSIPLDEIKLDRFFLTSMGTPKEERQRKMMENIIALAQDLGIRTVTEGVETEEHEAFLREIHCDYGQGYLYSRPIPAAEFEGMLRSLQGTPSGLCTEAREPEAAPAY